MLQLTLFDAIVFRLDPGGKTMARSIFLTLLVGAFFFVMAIPAQAGIPDLDNSYFFMAHGTANPVVLLVLPDGTGNPFSEAQILDDGTRIDATITLVLLDNFFTPIATYPFEDMWLESSDGGLIPCIGGTTADSNSDANGETTWANPLRAGGSSSEVTYVVVSGAPLTSNPPLDLKFNSPDIDGDGYVNLMDVTLFSAAYFGPYDFSCDFYADGVLNLLDVSLMATGLGASCP
jgi:hypothetical protein